MGGTERQPVEDPSVVGEPPGAAEDDTDEG